MKSWFPVAFLIFISSCNRPDLHVIQHPPTVPVLKFREHNNVLAIKITNKDSLNVIPITEFVISISGTSRPGDISSASVWHMSPKESFIGSRSEKISETEVTGERLHLRTSFDLKESENNFMVSLKLKDDADISGTISAFCESISTARGKLSFTSPDTIKPQRIGVAVRKQNDDGVNTFRIPGLVTTNKGTLLACYDARRASSRDLQGDIDIGISRSTDGGSSWEPMIVALDMREFGGLPEKFNGVSDASLLVDKKTGDILVAGLWMHGVIDENGRWIENLSDTSKAWNHQWRTKGSQPGFGIRETSQFLIARSSDDGISWSKPVNLTAMCKKKEWWLWAPAPGNGITMSNGTLVLPTQGRNESGEPFSNITYSTDGGRSWKTSNPAFTNTTECAVAELSDGTLMLNMRNNRNRNNEGPDNGRAVSVTSNMGQTWTVHPTSMKALPEPVCMGSLIRHDYESNGTKKHILFFSNPDTKKGRHHMTIKMSLDDGMTWPEKYWTLIDEGSGFGYSCLTSVDNNHIGILYEGSQAQLVFQKIDINEILNRQ